VDSEMTDETTCSNRIIKLSYGYFVIIVDYFVYQLLLSKVFDYKCVIIVLS